MIGHTMARLCSESGWDCHAHSVGYTCFKSSKIGDLACFFLLTGEWSIVRAWPVLPLGEGVGFASLYRALNDLHQPILRLLTHQPASVEVSL